MDCMVLHVTENIQKYDLKKYNVVNRHVACKQIYHS